MQSKILLALLFFLLSDSSHSQEILDRIVAQVANEPILETELIQAAYFEAQNANLDIFRDEAKLDSMKRVVLKNLIDFRVLLAAAKADTNIRVNENEIITKANADYQKLLSQAGTEERLAEKFRSSTKKIKKDLEENARKNTYVQKYVEKKLENVRVSKAEVTKFWEENRDKFNKLPATVRLANILLTIQPNEVAKRQALQKADSIKNLLDKGKDFAELAKQYSTDNSAKYGGDLGEVERGTFLPEFETVVYKLSEGEISKPVETKYGFHIIKLHYRRGNKFHVSHILIGLTPTTEDTLATKSKADSLYQRIKAGESFEQIAKGVSEDAETAKRGGDMGWIELEKLPDFATPIKNLKDGECTAPFLFAGSYHILKRVQTNPERYPNLQEDWDKIEQLAQSKARAMAYENLVESAKKKVYIQLMQE